MIKESFIKLLNVGTIPTSIGSLTNLVRLVFAFNSMNGMCFKGSIYYHVLYTYDTFSGAIPSTIGSLNGLTYLDLESGMP